MCRLLIYTDYMVLDQIGNKIYPLALGRKNYLFASTQGEAKYRYSQRRCIRFLQFVKTLSSDSTIARALLK